MGDELWTRERLDLLIIRKIEENYQLDYKAAGALASSKGKKDEITKDVSSFANSNGGTVIYGIKEFDEKDKKHLPEKVDPVDGRAFTREWLDQIIGQINPRIEGIRIVPVRVGTQEWETCYVIEIPKGETAHQARDFRYYRRYNFQGVPMPDHEVRDVMNRRRCPKLEFRVRLWQTRVCSLKVILNIRNVGKVVPRVYATTVLLPTYIRGKLFKEGLMECPIDGNNFWRITIVGNDPIFPESDVYCEYEIHYAIGRPPEPAGPDVICTLYADEMPCVRRKVPVESALNDWC
jgi:hypothetical protein